MPQPLTLKELGWSADFLRQLEIDEIGRLVPARVTGVHRDRVAVLTETGAQTLHLPPGVSTGDLAVGDWLLAEPETETVARVLERHSLLHRRAAGEDARDQLIAANVDTLFITTSMNADFNLARLERYLALAYAAGIAPVFVLTKADLTDAPEPYLDGLRQIAPTVPVVSLDARDTDDAAQLKHWCGPGQTVAFLGSSGVGKSTLVSALTGDALATAGMREDDAKGRHTTTARSFHHLAEGGWLVDTPGMRALRLAGVDGGIDTVFSELTELALQCKFSDCAHDTEPGCAVQAAIEAGQLAPERLVRWQKLKNEDARNSASIAESHARNRKFGRMVKAVKKTKRGR